MEDPKIRIFKARHKSESLLEGIIHDKHTRESEVDSFRLGVIGGEPIFQKFFITLPKDMRIPSIALTKGDKVCVYVVADETDKKNGYDGSLRGLANITTNRIYEFDGQDPQTYVRAIIGTSEVR